MKLKHAIGDVGKLMKSK